jgi:hypothetical protein
MVRLSFLFIVAAFTVVGTARSQESKPVDPKSKAGASGLTVPAYPNANCPIMGRPASAKLYVDTAFGRIYVCCAPCIKKIRLDPDGASKTAYPKTTKVENTVCPVMGEAIEPGSPTVKLQGYEVNLCCKDCVQQAKDHAQVVLAKTLNPKVRDVGNTVCPVTGKAVVANTFALIGDEMVRLSSAKCIEEVEKAPAETLKKAKESAAKGAESKPAEKPPVKKEEPGHGGHGHR